MKNYFTHSGKQESREVTITDLDMRTFDYFCNPSIFGKNAGLQGQGSKRLASAAGGLPLYLWENCRGRAVQQKIGERYRWGATPLSLAKMQGQGNKKLASATAGGLPLIFGKNAGARQCSKKIGERYRWGATPLSLGKMQGQGSAVKNWRALLGGYPSILQEQGIAVKPLYLWQNCRGKAVQ